MVGRLIDFLRDPHDNGPSDLVVTVVIAFVIIAAAIWIASTLPPVAH